jgi:nucleoside-diphosphate-sugar epimerase
VKKNTVLIFNKGSFANGLKERIEQAEHEIVLLIETPQKDLVNFIPLLQDNLDIIKKQIGDLVIIFVSGETRNDEKMLLLNVDYPKSIMNWCSLNNTRFVYLSSLAVFVNNNDDAFITINSSRKPNDEYGKTKDAFDNYVKNCTLNSGELLFSALLPASFYSGNGRSSVEKMEKIMKRYPVVFKNVEFPGSMSYICVSRLYDEIISVISYEGSQFRIVSSELSLSDIRKSLYDTCPIIKIPNIPVKTWKYVSIFVPNVLAYKMKLLLTRVVYCEG